MEVLQELSVTCLRCGCVGGMYWNSFPGRTQQFLRGVVVVHLWFKKPLLLIWARLEYPDLNLRSSGLCMSGFRIWCFLSGLSTTSSASSVSKVQVAAGNSTIFPKETNLLGREVTVRVAVESLHLHFADFVG